MRSAKSILCIVLLLAVLLPLLVPGVYALWVYLNDPEPMASPISGKVSNFHYGTLYITKITVKGGSYESISTNKTADTNMSADLKLTSAAASSVSVDVTFYNSTDVVYYYNETQTVSSNNTNIGYQVTGIAQKDPVDPKSYKTLTVTFSHEGNPGNTALLSELHFNFVVDKDSIGVVVAQTAVDRFRDILNDVVAPDSYETLETAMNNRGGSYNKASAVTYIGNVVGSSSTDSAVIESLFTTEFLTMDLDGDGKAEPITMMIKRENLDGNVDTGASYTYVNRNNSYTVPGVEMTIYITSQNPSSSRTITVYAAAFTIPEGGDEWVELVPLTKGTATSNNYNGFGASNSFNTDTWRDENGRDMDSLAS